MSGSKTKTGKSRSWSFLALIVVNIVLLSGAFFLYGRYTQAYQKSLREENLNNISNLNKSSMAIVTAVLDSWNVKLNDIAEYAEHEGLDYEQTCDMISDFNSQEDIFFQILDSSYNGRQLTKNEDGSYPEISYAHGSYAVQQKAFDDINDNGNEIRFVPELTNDYTKSKVFAIYKHITLANADGIPEVYTLLLASNSDSVLSAFNHLNGYDGQSTVLIDSTGNYIIKNRDFTSTNFYQFIANSNDLTLDQLNAIRSNVLKNGSGELLYKNSKLTGQDCVFRYEKMAENDWYCVTAVPESAFKLPEFNYNYIIYTVLLLIALLVLDITWLQITNRLLRISARREAEANNAKSSFMSRMSHEIRTPLNAVIGYNTIAKSELSGDYDEAGRRSAEMRVMDCLTKSETASKHLLTIINDVLDMSAIESGKIKVAHDRFDFRSLITSLTTIFYSQAKAKGVNFEVIFDTLNEEWFVGDQMRVNQILTNLLSNAIKFTPEGGTVKLLISQPEAQTNASHIHFEVSDTGIGMTSEYLERIWAPFEQADSSISRRFGGTGLGLTITKNLVDLMNGKISVESESGVGTVFCVDLTFERTEQPVNNAAYDFSRVNALVVDDDTCTCEYIQQLFARCGARCDTFTSGEEALRAFKLSNDSDFPYTICLVDWRMPKMDGLETIKRLREIAKREIPVIVITAYDFSEISEKAAEVGVDMFIAKPLFQSSLFDMLANISGKKEPETLKKNKKYDLKGVRVLLAEDNAMNKEIAKKILESAGVEVDSVWNGKEAVEMFENSPAGTYSVILMDVHMPVMDGHTATGIIRASSHTDAKTIPIIAMTADAFAENVAQAHEAGMNDHISKPIDIATLFETIKKYIKK
ncbi:MAG: response regulator [Clostridiales bacterium]|nr:response regulator [Clostridiales bacterium]